MNFEQYSADLDTLDYQDSKISDKTTISIVEIQLFEIEKDSKTIQEWAQRCMIENYNRGDKFQMIINTKTHNHEVEFTIQDNMHQHTEDFGITNEEYFVENVELNNVFQQIQQDNPSITTIENYKYLVYSTSATPEINQPFKDADLDLLAFVTNLFNHSFGDLKLFVTRNPLNNKNFLLRLSSSYLIDSHTNLTKQQFYEIMQEIAFITSISLELSLLFQSIQHSKQQFKREIGNDQQIEDIVIRYMEKIKIVIKEKLKKKNEKVEAFIYQNL